MKVPRLLLTVIIILAAYILLKLVQPPIPASVMEMYMAVIVIVTLLFMTYSQEGLDGIVGPVKAVLGDPNLKVLRGVVFVIFPIIVGYLTYTMVKPSFEEPPSLRVQHPAPPGIARIFNKSFNLQTAKNPYRVEDPEELKKNIREGGEVYYKNCFFCHGDKLAGAGHYAPGFNPIPINFTDVGTIAQLQEAYVFWRIATGGPGLPGESTPWLSSMPVWQNFLSEEEIWKVVLFIYDYTGYAPRTWD
ncbi:MAG: cytochrome c [Thermodesulfobacteriota bacterium]